MEAAEIETWYGATARAKSLLKELGPDRIGGSQTRVARLTLAELHLRELDVAGASEVLSGIASDASAVEPGYQSRVRCVQAYALLRMGSPEASERIDEAFRLAERQGAKVWAAYAQLLAGLESNSLSATIVGLPERARNVISLLAEPIAEELHALDQEAREILMGQVALRPERWRPVIRSLVEDRAARSRVDASKVLDVIGESADIQLLRSVARENRRSGFDPGLGKGLARRLADPVFVEDLGRVVIRVGVMEVAGSSIRRKVLALLCLLISRPAFAATRDEVLDALWPDMDPMAAVNSLNQTVYFLRRVFEPEYNEDLSPGYVHHESEILWLDRDLISSLSHQCAELVAQAQETSSSTAVDQLSEKYSGKFALDFIYEEWGAEYRDALHLAYLQIVEAAVSGDIAIGRYARGISMARRALVVESKLESLERSLLRLFRLTGAHAAAAEQYQHYASMLRDESGIEPPPLESM
jgi:DNA-binding SARP family transcriptional activator